VKAPDWARSAGASAATRARVARGAAKERSKTGTRLSEDICSRSSGEFIAPSGRKAIFFPRGVAAAIVCSTKNSRPWRRGARSFDLAQIAEISSTLRAMRWTTPDSTCASPAMRRASRRHFRALLLEILGQTMNWPRRSRPRCHEDDAFAVAGRWRISTRPATVTREGSTPRERASPRRARFLSREPARKKATGWPFSDSDSAR